MALGLEVAERCQPLSEQDTLKRDAFLELAKNENLSKENKVLCSTCRQDDKYPYFQNTWLELRRLNESSYYESTSPELDGNH